MARLMVLLLCAALLNGTAWAVDADVLSAKDVVAYKRLWRAAEAGKKPDVAEVEDDILMGHVMAAYLLGTGHTSTFAELEAWLREYRHLDVAGDIYALAEARREKPRRECTTRSVAKKIKDKKGKTKTVQRKQKSCKSVGKWGPAPTKTLAMENKERAERVRESEREARLAKLSAQGRKILGESWRARVRGKYDQALKVLLAPNARVEAGSVAWQDELVRVAGFYHGKRAWTDVLRAAGPASAVKGPARDEALWLAGFASFRLGKVRDAAELWQDLVEEDDASGTHHARAAWWAARAYDQLGQKSKVKSLLQEGAKDRTSFYGQLCAAKLGWRQELDWDVPRLGSGEMERLKKVKVARLGLALAQVGRVDEAQRALRAGYDDLPYQLSRALAVAALEADMPAVALRAGRDLLERGEVVPAVLYPKPHWRPRGGSWKVDEALVYGIMKQESAFQPSIGSWAGAQGLMQIMPATGAYVARMVDLPKPSREDLHDPALNLTLAQEYLQYLGGKLDGNLMLVVAAYNGGVGNVRKWLDRGVTPGDDPVMWLESIPFDETRGYVEKVFSNYWIYQNRLGKEPWSLRTVAEGNWPLRWSAWAADAQPEG